MTDQNLLFGVLSLQLEFIDAQRLAEACSVWAARKDSPLSDVMVARGWITESEKDEVLRLLQRKLQRKDGDVRRTLAELAGANVRDIIRSVGEADVDVTLSELGGGPGFVQITNAVEPSSGERSHFTLSRVHEEGGLGRVWVAYDRNLCRDVALKEIRPDKRPGKVALHRFIQEAQIAGQLEHPNIVPVYELVRDAEREFPFYTMRFVRGKSLSAEIDEHHRARLPETSKVLSFRRLLGALVNVCNAIGYAHSKGVIHRDLKPANVMLGDYGEVVVLDWGLAKVMDKADDETEDLRPVEVRDAVGSADTQTGHALGTPAYMAPEQAAGRRSEIGSLTDVYGLGAILYRILTGRRPHTGRDSRETIRHAIEEAPPEPRTVDPSVPRALNAICVKAMAKDQADRYPSCLALAKDIQRWLADEPVSAYSDPWHVRIARWGRKHKAATVAAGTVLAVVTVVASIACVMVHHAWREAEKAKIAALDALEISKKAQAAEARARKDALKRLREAMEITDRMATCVSDQLRYFPGSQPLRETLLGAAAEHYRSFAAEEHEGHAIRLESANAQIRLGDVLFLMEKREDAADAYRSAQTELAQLASSEGLELDLRQLQALNLRKLGEVLTEQGQHEEAGETYQEAAELLAEAPTSQERVYHEAELSLRRAYMEHDRGNTDASLTWLQKAAGVLPKQPTDLRLVELAARVRSERGKALAAAGKNREALGPATEAWQIYDALAAHERDYPPYLEGLAYSESSLAWAHRPLGRTNDEAVLLQHAIANFSTLIHALSGVPHLWENRATAQVQYALVLHGAHRNTEAKPCIDEAIEVFTFLWNSPAGQPRHLDGLAQAAIVLSRILRDLNLHEDAERNLRSAIYAYVYELMSPGGDNDSYLLGAAVASRHLGRLLHSQGRFEEAEMEFQIAAGHLQRLLDKEYGEPDSIGQLACCYEYWGDLRADSQTVDEARSLYFEALAQRERLPDYPDYIARHIRLLLKCGGEEELQKAAESTTALRNEVPDNAAYQSLQGLVHYRLGQLPECIQVLEGLDANGFDSPGPEYCFLMAMAYRERNQPGDAPASQEYLQRACDWMDRESPGNLDLVRLREEATSLMAGGEDDNAATEEIEP
jgi:serine/threonine-protein kinase